MELIEIFIVAMSPSINSPGKFALILEDTDKKNRFPLLIGEAEALSIGVALEKIKTQRPLTHDLFFEVISLFDAKVDHVWIKEVKDNIFKSEIVLKKTNQTEELRVDSRTSDAIALALRFDSPIMISRQVLEEQRLDMDIYVGESNRTAYSAYTLEELERLLQNVLAKEDYQSAVRIREVIAKRKNNDK
ncbi:bifunctional nuclease family protein [Pararhodonellum marinum]|uniref:bifunctional nuclease family protein n=1 Tax=Pararhodonellum marinum TaxID=2755358 RepID=UPI00188F3D79|nr:bifunctional nuclease family protein [Pararhodonellum marinum]